MGTCQSKSKVFSSEIPRKETGTLKMLKLTKHVKMLREDHISLETKLNKMQEDIHYIIEHANFEKTNNLVCIKEE